MTMQPTLSLQSRPTALHAAITRLSSINFTEWGAGGQGGWPNEAKATKPLYFHLDPETGTVTQLNLS